MKFFLALLLFIAIQTGNIHAQEIEKQSNELTTDTLEGISTDSSIVYIIKKPPVTIKERIEIFREREKRNFHITLGLAPTLTTNRYKPANGFESYTKNLNASLTPETGISIFMQVYRVPKKIIGGISVEGERTTERFKFTSIDGTKNSFQNSYFYAGMGVVLGKWFRKQEKISFQLLGYPVVNYVYGMSGYYPDKTNPNSTIYIVESIAYKKVNLRFSLFAKVLLKTKKSFIEIAPFAILYPFSMTKKEEAFSIRRNCFGLSFNITNQLF